MTNAAETGQGGPRPVRAFLQMSSGEAALEGEDLPRGSWRPWAWRY